MIASNEPVLATRSTKELPQQGGRRLWILDASVFRQSMYASRISSK